MGKKRKRQKPENADFYAWDKFEKWADENGVSDEFDEDWTPSWECWKAGYIAAMNS